MWIFHSASWGVQGSDSETLPGRAEKQNPLAYCYSHCRCGKDDLTFCGVCCFNQLKRKRKITRQGFFRGSPATLNPPSACSSQLLRAGQGSRGAHPPPRERVRRELTSSHFRCSSEPVSGRDEQHDAKIQRTVLGRNDLELGLFLPRMRKQLF